MADEQQLTVHVVAAGAAQLSAICAPWLRTRVSLGSRRHQLSDGLLRTPTAFWPETVRAIVEPDTRSSTALRLTATASMPST